MVTMALAFILPGNTAAGQESPRQGAHTAVETAASTQTQDANSSKSDDTDSQPIYADQPSMVRGSPYVELDSWIYPAIERLAALGFIHSQFLDMRPWTRIECARMLQEAEEQMDAGGSVPAQADQIYASLEEEFRPEIDALNGKGRERSIQMESIYTNVTGITGKPLNDGYHFGQTIINNYGRPYQEGFNTYDGFSGYAIAGRFALYVRGEYQHAPSAPAYPLSVREVIATTDANPLQPAVPFATVNRFTLLDTYAAVNAGGWDFAFGKQSLWWGPDEGGAFLFSDNAEPIYMFRASRITDFRIPLLSRLLGPFKVDAFFGKLSDNQFPPRPFIHGEKISFKPTENLELGFSRTAEFGGVGRAFTLGHIWRSYFTFASPRNETAANDPGKQTGGFDLTYRVPFVRNWLTLYTDSIADDDPSPLAAPRRAGIRPGIYLARLPRIPKLDLRLEAVYTDIPTSRSNGGRFIYFDTFYHDLYTNKNNLIGDWIGREGMGFQGWSTYWFNPRSSLQIGYRHAKVAKDFIPDGETLNDASIKLNWWFCRSLSVSGYLQYEKWLAPVFVPTAQTNWTSSVEVTFWPQSWSR